MKMIAAVRSLLVVCFCGFAVSLLFHILAAIGINVPHSVFVVLFLTLFPIAGFTGLLQLRVQFIEDDWVTNSWETLTAGIPMWLWVLCSISVAYILVATFSFDDVVAMYSMVSAGYICEAAALFSFHSQPWLVTRLKCPNGHRINHFNRFCPTCGASLPKVSASA